MNILVVGSGGREHAVIKALKKSKKTNKLYCAPGNGGIGDEAICVPVNVMDIPGMVEFAKKTDIDLVCVTPDDPLCAGMTDAMISAGIRAFGPSAAAALIEGSKVYSKSLMKKYGIPTGGYEVFDDIDKAKEYIIKSPLPIVIKADGLALGKGVIICRTAGQAMEAVDDIMGRRKFGEAGSRIVIEEFLEGPEVSVLAFCDGSTIKMMPSSQDHKKAYDGDLGPNTGGMGTFTPSLCYTPEIDSYCMEKIYLPTVNALKEEGRQFRGVLYFGLILTNEGPKVLEYNARFGDPETQVILPLLKTDLLDIFNACIDGRLAGLDIEWENKAVVCVILASGGYPEEYVKGYAISGLEDIKEEDGVLIYHAGTKKTDGMYYTNGGRVLGVAAKDNTIQLARERAYEAVGKISFNGMSYRKDIGIK